MTLAEALLTYAPVSLYGAQALTYVIAARAARGEGSHSSLPRCYAISSLIHGLLGIAYVALAIGGGH